MQSVDNDDNRSWAAAAIIMEVATAFTVTMRVLGMDPFTIVFDLFIVYIPTAILVNSIIFEWVKRSALDTATSTRPSSVLENTAV